MRLLTLASDPDRENEDAFALGYGVTVVVDGAGIPKHLRPGCSHSIAWYARSVAGTLRDRLVNDRVGGMRAALADTIRDVTGSHGGCDLAQGSPSATVAAWRIRRDRVEYLVLADASVVLAHADGTVREVNDDRLARVTEPIVRGHLAALRRGGHATTAEDVRSARRAAVEATRNTPGGFWCCHTDSKAADHAQVGVVPQAELLGIIAASDGATRGYQLLGMHALPAFAQQALSDCLPRLGLRIREAERARAPELTDQGLKLHDDITLVSQRFEPGR